MPTDNPYQSPLDPAGERPSQVRSRPWLLYFCVIAAAGLGIACAGFVYGVVLVGVPTQDATPQVAQRLAFHVLISSGLAVIGAFFFLCGALGAGIRLAILGVGQLRARRSVKPD